MAYEIYDRLQESKKDEKDLWYKAKVQKTLIIFLRLSLLLCLKEKLLLLKIHPKIMRYKELRLNFSSYGYLSRP